MSKVTRVTTTALIPALALTLGLLAPSASAGSIPARSLPAMPQNSPRPTTHRPASRCARCPTLTSRRPRTTGRPPASSTARRTRRDVERSGITSAARRPATGSLSMSTLAAPPHRSMQDLVHAARIEARAQPGRASDDDRLRTGTRLRARSTARARMTCHPPPPGGQRSDPNPHSNVRWMPCDCRTGELGHLVVSCQASGCRSRWYLRAHHPQAATLAYPPPVTAKQRACDSCRRLVVNAVLTGHLSSARLAVTSTAKSPRMAHVVRAKQGSVVVTTSLTCS